MMEPIYRIYYGKYPDLLAGEIPNEQIVSVDGLTFRIEPGKPAEPKVDQASFTLSNIVQADGTERYDESWFADNSVTEAEGAIVPDQMFFRIEMPEFGQKGFTGILTSKSYGKWRETVTVTIKDPKEIISKSKSRMFKGFKFDDAVLTTILNTAHAENEVGTGTDLDGNSLTQQALKFNALRVPRVIATEPVEFTDPYTLHADLRGTTTPDLGTPLPGDGGSEVVFSRVRYTFVQIHDITLLTRIKEEVVYWIYTSAATSTTYHWRDLVIYVWHANNGNYVDQGVTTLERGRYFDQNNEDVVAGQLPFTIWDYNLGNDDDILVTEDDVPFSTTGSAKFMHGAPVLFDGSNNYSINQNFTNWFDQLTKLQDVYNNKLLSFFYKNPANVDQFDISIAPDKHRLAFYADIMLYGWLDTEPGDILVTLATQLSCYLYFNEQGKIVFHPRNYHEQYLPGNMPPGSFQVQLDDIKPLGEQTESDGFTTYEIEYGDRIEINNVESDLKKRVVVNSDGTQSEPALRSTDLTIKAFRSSDLGVPTPNMRDDRKVLRYSPDDPDFPVVSGVAESLADFLPLPETQAQEIAKSWSFPVKIWNIKLSMKKYPDAGIGGYFWVDWTTEKRVYFIRQITYRHNWSAHIEVQEVGVYNG